MNKIITRKELRNIIKSTNKDYLLVNRIYFRIKKNIIRQYFLNETNKLKNSYLVLILTILNLLYIGCILTAYAYEFYYLYVILFGIYGFMSSIFLTKWYLEK